MASDEFQVLPIPENRKDRFGNLQSLFRQKFGEDSTFIARAPGRVNLIGARNLFAVEINGDKGWFQLTKPLLLSARSLCGKTCTLKSREHIDYCGYSVLPMALEQDIVMAVTPDRSGKITLKNTDPQYEEFTCDVMEISITKDKPSWYKYILCGVLGMKESFCSLITLGFKALVDGNVPQSAGLSSSSALVCCASLAMLKANSWPMSKEKLAEACAKCERYIGTEGGGMDQAISLMAESGKAKLIEFNPLRTTDIQLPSNAAFIVSNSLAEMNKAATPHFNIRVVECRLAAQLIASTQSGLKWREIKKLGDLPKKLEIGLEDILSVMNKSLHTEPYSKEEICKLLETNPDELAQTSLSANTLNVDTFYLHQRATHVYSEAQRVLNFKKVCNENPPNALEQLGELMNASHASCRDLYECSHPDLDKLVETCRQHGAIGSRMTGAGWGGCAVSIINSDKVPQMLEGVKKDYYSIDKDKAAKVNSALFATKPGGGAVYYLSN